MERAPFQFFNQASGTHGGACATHEQELSARPVPLPGSGQGNPQGVPQPLGRSISVCSDERELSPEEFRNLFMERLANDDHELSVEEFRQLLGKGRIR